MIEYAADFEATTQEEDCHVWAWGVAEVSRSPEETFAYGADIEGFIEWATDNPGRYWFHNLGYDGKFVVWWLLEHGFRWVPDKPQIGEFTTLISDMGRWYSLEWAGEQGRVRLADSFNKLPFKLSIVAGAYGLEVTKGEIDYDLPRPLGYRMTDLELDYLRRDVFILAQAMSHRLEMGAKLTTGADCLANFKDLIGERKFNTLFPMLNPILDGDLRKAYRGGYVYVAPQWKNVVMGTGIRLDVNSLYPWAMRENVMPFGKPKRGKGKPKPTKEYPLWVGEVTFTAKLKPGKLPCIQPKSGFSFNSREYITETAEPLTMWFCNVDWALIEESYDLTVYEWGGYYLFHGQLGMYDDYIDTGMVGKANATSAGERQNWKLWLNNLYGKTGQKIDVTGKQPKLGLDHVVSYVQGKKELRDPVYVPTAVFTTAYARNKTIRTAWLFGDRFAYCDTDSIHAAGTEVPEGVEVHPTNLGAWKLEATFTRAKFLRCKTYVEDVIVSGDETKLEFTCAGMSEGLKSVMTFDDFAPGFTTDTRLGEVKPQYLDQRLWKLVPKNVVGGVVLVPRPFTIHP
jgi:hypothetical protein